MKKAELMSYVGKKVRIYFKDGDELYGTLKYVDEFSAKHDYRKLDYFYVGKTSFNFKVSHVRKLEESEDK